MASDSTMDRVARKNHRCFWCGEYIKKSERYKERRIVVGNHHSCERYHMECYEARMNTDRETLYEFYYNDWSVLFKSGKTTCQ